MEWNVFRHNSNGDRIEKYNVFRHGGFVGDIVDLAKKRKNKDEFAEGLLRALFYWFGYKFEWEILLCPMCAGRNDKPLRVDVRDQVMANWEPFLEYVWANRNDLTTSRK